MVSNFGVSFKLRDIKGVREQCIGSSLSSSKAPLPQEEKPNDHQRFWSRLPSNGRPKKRSGGLSVTHLISKRKSNKHSRPFVKPVIFLSCNASPEASNETRMPYWQVSPYRRATVSWKEKSTN